MKGADVHANLNNNKYKFIKCQFGLSKNLEITVVTNAIAANIPAPSSTIICAVNANAASKKKPAYAHSLRKADFRLKMAMTPKIFKMAEG